MKTKGKSSLRTYTVTLANGKTFDIEGTRLEETETGVRVFKERSVVVGFDWSELKSILRSTNQSRLEKERRARLVHA
jgi:hypothetical protein